MAGLMDWIFGRKALAGAAKKGEPPKAEPKGTGDQSYIRREIEKRHPPAEAKGDDAKGMKKALPKKY